MSKSSKQKSKKNKTKQRRGEQKQIDVTLVPPESQPAISDLLETALHEAKVVEAKTVDEAQTELEIAVDIEAAVDGETEDERESLLVTKPTAAQELRAALLAKQKQQPKGWKQQVKAGKMTNAHVPKRFNRGG